MQLPQLISPVNSGCIDTWSGDGVFTGEWHTVVETVLQGNQTICGSYPAPLSVCVAIRDASPAPYYRWNCCFWFPWHPIFIPLKPPCRGLIEITKPAVNSGQGYKWTDRRRCRSGWHGTCWTGCTASQTNNCNAFHCTGLKCFLWLCFLSTCINHIINQTCNCWECTIKWISIHKRDHEIMVISFQVILSLKYAHGGRTCQASNGFVVSAFQFCPAGRRHTNNNSLCMLDLCC